MMTAVRTYTLTSAVSGETATPDGLVEFEFKAGDVTPADAVEEKVLEDLVAAGIASVKVPAKPAKPTKVEE